MGNEQGKSKKGSKSSKDSKTTGAPITTVAENKSNQINTPDNRRMSVAEKHNVTLDDFVLLTTVGQGSFGKVIQVRKKDTGEILAMKILKKDHVIKRKQLEHTMAERRILEEIQHPFIVSLRFAFQTSQKLYMVFDFFNGGELFNYLSKGGKFTPERSQFYCAELALAIAHLHDLNIVYRDLKPENILLDADGHIRVADFGLSKSGVEGDTVSSFCGTPEYLAPEVLKRNKYGKAVDWWSLGTLLFEMLTGLPPFYDKNRERMYKKIMSAPLVFPDHIGSEARDLITKMLEREPRQRLGYNGPHEIKEHPYFQTIDWDALYHKRLRPPFLPNVADEMDLRNIDSSFTRIPAAVTPTPAEARILASATEEGKENFQGFTFTTNNVIDGQTYSVSFDEGDADNAPLK